MNQKNHLSRGKRLLLKAASLFLGFALWQFFMNHQIGYKQLHSQLSFHDMPATTCIKAPDSVEITVRGTESAINSIDRETLAFHIDASRLHEGENLITLTEHQLFLPERTELLTCTPSTILVYVQKKDY